MRQYWVDEQVGRVAVLHAVTRGPRLLIQRHWDLQRLFKLTLQDISIPTHCAAIAYRFSFSRCPQLPGSISGLLHT